MLHNSYSSCKYILKENNGYEDFENIFMTLFEILETGLKKEFIRK